MPSYWCKLPGDRCTIFARCGRFILPSPTANQKRTVVRGLGEIALRVNNLDAMQKFYEEVIGLLLIKRFPNAAFSKTADGYGGHTQVLALFDRSQSPGYRGTDAATSTIDLIAFEIPRAGYAAEKNAENAACNLRRRCEECLFTNSPTGPVFTGIRGSLPSLAEVGHRQGLLVGHMAARPLP